MRILIFKHILQLLLQNKNIKSLEESILKKGEDSSLNFRKINHRNITRYALVSKQWFNLISRLCDTMFFEYNFPNTKNILLKEHSIYKLDNITHIYSSNFHYSYIPHLSEFTALHSLTLNYCQTYTVKDILQRYPHITVNLLVCNEEEPALDEENDLKQYSNLGYVHIDVASDYQIKDFESMDEEEQQSYCTDDYFSIYVKNLKPTSIDIEFDNELDDRFRHSYIKLFSDVPTIRNVSIDDYFFNCEELVSLAENKSIETFKGVIPFSSFGCYSYENRDEDSQCICDMHQPNNRIAMYNSNHPRKWKEFCYSLQQNNTLKELSLSDTCKSDHILDNDTVEQMSHSISLVISKNTTLTTLKLPRNILTESFYNTLAMHNNTIQHLTLYNFDDQHLNFISHVISNNQTLLSIELLNDNEEDRDISTEHIDRLKNAVSNSKTLKSIKLDGSDNFSKQIFSTLQTSNNFSFINDGEYIVNFNNNIIINNCK